MHFSLRARVATCLVWPSDCVERRLPCLFGSFLSGKAGKDSVDAGDFEERHNSIRGARHGKPAMMVRFRKVGHGWRWHHIGDMVDPVFCCRTRPTGCILFQTVGLKRKTPVDEYNSHEFDNQGVRGRTYRFPGQASSGRRAV